LHLTEFSAVDNDYLRASAWSGPGHNVRGAITIDVAQSHAHAAGERRRERIETCEQGRIRDLAVALPLGDS
jgi:hypothetical protein